MTSFPFRTALVTGASSGIGQTIVESLAADGVEVVVVARRQARLVALAQRFDGIEVLPADLTSADGVAAVTARIGDERRVIDLVVNNAGFGTTGVFAELDPARIAAEIALNVGALTQLSRAALAAMTPRSRGWLLNVSSVASFQPAPRLAVYAATKAYVTSLTESLHEEAKRDGVHVTALCPGLTPTEFQSVSNTDAYVAEFPSILWTTLERVVSTGLQGVIDNKALAVPGLQYQAMASIAGVLPRRVLRHISGLVQRT